MDKQALVKFIKRNTPSISVSQTALDSILESFEEKEFQKNEFLLKEGRISNYFYLAEGFARAFTFDTDGNEITTYFYAGDQVVFEVASFFLRQPSAESIQAITSCKAFILTFEQLNKLFHEYPEFREFGRAMLVKEFVAYKQRALSMINKSAEERYLQLLETKPELFQYAQLKQIATYLGITDTSLSRIRKEVSKK